MIRNHACAFLLLPALLLAAPAHAGKTLDAIKAQASLFKVLGSFPKAVL